MRSRIKIHRTFLMVCATYDRSYAPHLWNMGGMMQLWAPYPTETRQ